MEQLDDLDSSLGIKICYICNKKGHTQHNCKQFHSKISSIKKTDDDVKRHVVIEGVNKSDGVGLTDLMKMILKNLQLLKKVNYNQYQLQWRTFDKRYYRPDEVIVCFLEIELKRKFQEACRGLYNYYGLSHRYFDKPMTFFLEKKKFVLTFRNDISPKISKIYSKTLELQSKYGSLHISVVYDSVFVRKKFQTFKIENQENVNQLKELLSTMKKNKVKKARKVRQMFVGV